MKRILSTALAISLLLGLGALAIIASPNGAGSLLTASKPAAVALAASNFQGAAAPQAAQNANVIAMPLNATNQFTSAGLTYDQAGLAALVGPGVQQVLKWNAPTQSYSIWYPEISDGDPFPMETGGVYWLLLDSTSPSIVSFVGDVPAQGSVHFSLQRPSGAGCLINDISLPLDRSDITTPQKLGEAIGNVEQVAQWNATTQSYAIWYVDINDGDPITMKIGYPYQICLKQGGVTTWP